MTPEAVIKLANQLNDEVVEYLDERNPHIEHTKIDIKVDPYFKSARSNGRYVYNTKTICINQAIIKEEDIKTVIRLCRTWYSSWPCMEGSCCRCRKSFWCRYFKM